MARFILSLDQGTSSSRAILVDHVGRVVATAQHEFTQHFPQPGWVEHDAEEIWATQSKAMHEAIALAGALPGDIAAVGITNQRETTLVWDRLTGVPISRAIVWQDRRTAPECAALIAAGCEPEVSRRTGLRLDPYFSGTKLAWLLDHTPEARTRAERGELAFGTVDSWLAWKLTGGAAHITDASNASRTLLMTLETGEWDQYLLDLLRVPGACLPRIVAPSIAPPATVKILGRDVPLAAMAGDQQAALFGQACFRAGMAKNTYGTGCFMLMHTGTQPIQSKNRLLSTVAWDLAIERDGRARYFALEGSVFVAGAVVQWLRDGLGVIKHAAEVESLAQSVPDTGDTYLVPAFSGLGSPHWDANARGTIVGLTRGSTAAHLARAALEAIAFQCTEVLMAMQRDATVPVVELRVDGGACANNLLMQMQADLLGVPVLRPTVIESTALGAAFLAGLGVKFWQSLDELQQHWQLDRRFEPQISREQATDKMQRWSQAVQRSLSWSAG